MTSSPTTLSNFFARFLMVLSLLAVPVHGMADDASDEEGDNAAKKGKVVAAQDIKTDESAKDSKSSGGSAGVKAEGDVPAEEAVAPIHERLIAYVTGIAPKTWPVRIKACMATVEYRQHAHTVRRSLGQFWEISGAFMAEMYAMESDDVDAQAKINRSEMGTGAAQATKGWLTWAGIGVFNAGHGLYKKATGPKKKTA